MLSFVVIVYPEPRRVRFHPGQTVANAASCASSVFSNSFRSHSFRTLASHFQTSVSSISFEINRFRTFCKIPGIGYPFTQSVLREGPVAYPRRLPRRGGRCYPVALQQKHFYLISLHAVADSILSQRGGYPPSLQESRTKRKPESASPSAVADAPTRSPAGARPPGRLRECGIRCTLLLARS
jgi:hypothetical protein